MNDARFVCGFEGFSDLLGDGQRLVQRNWSAFDPIRQRWSLDEFENQRLGITRVF